MITKLPFQLPAGFLRAFGYRGHQRFISLFWEPCGDESCFEDGITSACGMTSNWLYLDFVRQPQVSRWLDQNEINLGNSDQSADHWLVVDALTNDLYVAPRREAYEALLRQQLPSEAPEPR